MGIKIEFNPDLALRKPGTTGRLEEECIPQKLEAGKWYNFIKSGQRIYWMEGEIPLLITDGEQNLSRPLASIKILSVMHMSRSDMGGICTVGKYEIKEVYDINDPTIHFEGFKKI